MARRLSRADYFEAALTILVKESLAGVTLASLCDALNVTRGSFYYHFSSIEDFMTKLLEYWQAQIEAISIDWTVLTPEEVIQNVHDRSILVLNHEAEREIRAYGRTRPETNAIIAFVDEQRRNNITVALTKAGIPAEEAAALGRIGAGLLIAEQQRVPVDREAIRAVYDEWAAWTRSRLREHNPDADPK